LPISTKPLNPPVSTEVLSLLAKQFLREKGHADLNGIIDSPIEGVRVFRDAKGCQKQPLLYQSGIIIMLQGTKRLYVNEREIVYKKGDYIVLGVPLPAQCAATLDEDDCILGLVIDVPPSLFVELSQWRERPPNPSDNSLFTVSQQSMNNRIADVTSRLLSVMKSDHQSKVLGAGFVREIIYHIVNGPAGHIICGLTENGHYARIANALTIIHDNYATKLNVDVLAGHVNMSISGFHRAFRDVVLESPVQYIKKIRLSKARELISSGYLVADAAEAVGYNSLSQFSREFKRYYQFTPVKDRHANRSHP